MKSSRERERIPRLAEEKDILTSDKKNCWPYGIGVERV